VAITEVMLMILLLSESDVASVISTGDGVRVVEQALRQHAAGGGVVMPRMSADVPGNGEAFRVMSAIMPELGFFGLKTLTGYPGRRLACETYFALLLFSCDTGALRAIVAGNRLTGIRTGAASGVAAKYLSRANSRVLGVIGAGVQARYQVAALIEVRPVKEIRVFDIDSAKAQAFAQELELEFQVGAQAVPNVRDALSGCDLIVTATAAKAPVFEGEWLEEGTHLSAMGSNTPNKRELDGTVFRRSMVVVDFKDQALQEAGDLQDAVRTGAIPAAAIDVELGDIITGKKPGRQNDREITLFKSVVMAVEDIATATFCLPGRRWRRAWVHGSTWMARACRISLFRSIESVRQKRRTYALVSLVRIRVRRALNGVCG
jgi:alanine dehydrogenase